MGDALTGGGLGPDPPESMLFFIPFRLWRHVLHNFFLLRSRRLSPSGNHRPRVPSGRFLTGFARSGRPSPTKPSERAASHSTSFRERARQLWCPRAGAETRSHFASHHIKWCFHFRWHAVMNVRSSVAITENFVAAATLQSAIDGAATVKYPTSRMQGRIIRFTPSQHVFFLITEHVTLISLA